MEVQWHCEGIIRSRLLTAITHNFHRDILNISACLFCSTFDDGVNTLQYVFKYKACPSESGTDKFMQRFI